MEHDTVDLEALLDKHKDNVYRQMVKLCGSYDDAEDALADAVLVAVKASQQLRNPAQFQAWLAQIGRRACFRMKVRDKLLGRVSLTDLNEIGIEVPDSTSGPEAEAEATAMKGCVSLAIETIPENLQQVYVLRDLQGESAEEVSRELGISIAAVKSRLHRARNIVREALDTGFGCRGYIEP